MYPKLLTVVDIGQLLDLHGRGALVDDNVRHVVGLLLLERVSKMLLIVDSVCVCRERNVHDDSLYGHRQSATAVATVQALLFSRNSP